MMQNLNLPVFAQQLCDEGLEAHELSVPVPGKGLQICLMVVGVGFFPLWELNNPINAGLVAARDFAEIKSKRPANWELVEPRLWDRLAPKES
jgi:hypothetical protein